MLVNLFSYLFCYFDILLFCCFVILLFSHFDCFDSYIILMILSITCFASLQCDRFLVSRLLTSYRLPTDSLVIPYISSPSMAAFIAEEGNTRVLPPGWWHFRLPRLRKAE